MADKNTSFLFLWPLCLCSSLYCSSSFLSWISVSIHSKSPTKCLWHGPGTWVVACAYFICVWSKVFRPKPWWQMPCLTFHPQGDSLRTSIQLDFGDGIKITYSNLSRTDDGIMHIYRTTGIYRVTASAENSQGSDSSTLFLHITSMWIRNVITHSCGSACSMNRFLFHG